MPVSADELTGHQVFSLPQISTICLNKLEIILFISKYAKNFKSTGMSFDVLYFQETFGKYKCPQEQDMKEVRGSTLNAYLSFIPKSIKPYVLLGKLTQSV